MAYAFIVFFSIAIVSGIILIVEAKNAPIVDSKEPFLYDDYDPKDED